MELGKLMLAAGAGLIVLAIVFLVLEAFLRTGFLPSLSMLSCLLGPLLIIIGALLVFGKAGAKAMKKE